ncbi:MAG: hypothetical protein DCC49_07740 [Acidobacteria bacterium]|nr:MAG: hypothetical protein DCC49_07740 [Acidobacteriota bacterium]
MDLGEIRVTPISDGEAKLPAHLYFQGSTAADWESHKDMLDGEGNYVFPLGAFVIESGGKKVLVDAGLGDVDAGFARGGALMDSLAKAGVDPSEISTVFITHFHVDHVGWILTGDRITFPNAEIAITAEELAFWQDDPPPNSMIRFDIIEAMSERTRLVADGETLAPGVDVIALPGHTPGSAGLVISSGAERALLLGDAISCPVQLEESEWYSMADVDPDLAKATRETLWRETEGTDTLVGAAHFPNLEFGRILLGEGKRYFGPL